MSAKLRQRALAGCLLAGGLAAGMAAAGCDATDSAQHAHTRLASAHIVGVLGRLVESPRARKERCRKPPPSTALAHPSTNPEQLAEKVADAPESLGAASVGAPTRGALWGGKRLLSSPSLEVVTEPYSWGTDFTVDAIERAANNVACRFPGSHKLHVGSLSRKTGGPLFPHRSHQSGLDVDVGFYYTDGSTWYQYATKDRLDRERTWAFIEALYDGGNVEYLFIDRRVEELLREHAEEVSPHLIVPLFDGTPAKQPLIRHARGHRTHMHVRFFDESARKNAKRLLPFIGARYQFARHR